MRRLPLIAPTHADERDSTGTIQLPCPAVDLIEMAMIDDQQPLRLQQLLRFNPSIFMFGLAAFYDSNQTAPNSFGQLCEWSQDNLLNQFAGLPSGWSEIESFHTDSCKPHLSQPRGKNLKEFFATRKNGQIRDWISKFVLRLTGHPMKSTKQWVKQIVGKSLSFQQLKHLNELAHRKSQRNRIVNKWKHGGDRAFDIEAVFQLRWDSESIKSEFETRLTRAKLAAMKELAYGASHEINNPLANISIRAQTLLATESDPERRQKMSVIYEQALRAHEMISDLMLFANPPAIQYQSTDLRLWISKLVTEISPSLTRLEVNGMRVEQEPIEFEARVGPKIQQLDIDPTQLSVALKSLIRNSIESIRTAARSGKISLRVFQTTDGWIGFSVTDDGEGVLVSAQPHLFDPFYSSRESGRGLGFGLSKAWRIAELHGGRLQFNEHHTPGAQFALLIPLSRPKTSTTTDATIVSAEPRTQKSAG